MKDMTNTNENNHESPSGEFFYLFDLDQRFTYVNDSLLNLWQLSLSEVIGKNFSDLNYPEHLVELHKAQLKEALTGRIVHGENHFTGPDGTTDFYEYTFVPVIDSTGKITAIAGSTRNVTKRKTLERQLLERENYFRTFAEAMPQMAFIANEKGEITYFNQSWYDYVQLQGTEGHGWKDLPIHHPDDLLPTLERWNLSVKTGIPYEIEYRLRRHDGKYLWHLGRALPVRDATGNISMWIGTNTDIDSQKQKIEKFYNALSESQDINVALEEQKHLREKFVNGISHDLRTPLTVAKLNAQILKRNFENPEIHKIAQMISNNMERADRMIRDMLDGSYIDTGKALSLNFQEFQINELIHNVISDFNTIYGKRFEINQNDSIVGTWDIDAVRRILENLLTNAIKYGKPSATVTISIEKLENNFILLSVHNHGPAVGKDELASFFDKSRKPSFQLKRQNGWGIGLTLVRGLCEAHGGQVSVKSNDHDGTTFLILLPLHSEHLITQGQST